MKWEHPKTSLEKRARLDIFQSFNGFKVLLLQRELEKFPTKSSFSSILPYSMTGP